MRLVEEAGHENAGVVIDTWHIARANTPASALATVPQHRIIGVELNDADPEVVGTLFEDTVHRRRYRGEGSLDLVVMVAALRTAGWTGPLGVEILCDEHHAMTVEAASPAPPTAPDACSEPTQRSMPRPALPAGRDSGRSHDYALARRGPGIHFGCRGRCARRALAQTFCGKPSSMPPWLGSSQREVTTLPRV